MQTIRVPIFTTVVACGLLLPYRYALADNAIATESLPIAWQDDAELTDVCFVNRNVGWAVGAQGLILRTTDGGKTWLQPTDVSVGAIEQQVSESRSNLPLSQKLSRMQQGPQTRLAQRNVVTDASRHEIRIRFESVHFVDPMHGWAAGGYNVPWMDRSRGLIMQTRDGGRTWRHVKRLTIPRVNKIRFTSRRSGWAIGEANALHPDGIYFTNDGGATWSSQTTERMDSWVAGQQAGGQFALIDREGRLASIVGGKMSRPALFNCSREDRIDCLVMQNDQIGFAAGQGGLVLKTTDGGRSWKRWSVDTGIDESVRSMTVNNQNLFMALVTGGMVRVGMQDQVVEQIALPTSMPIRAIQFVDSEVGYAVGELGTILSTSDGGQTWRKQRGDHDRLAILLVANRPEDVALSLMAYNAGEDGRLCGTLVLESQPAQQAVVTQAFERLGSAVNWQCNVTEENQISDSLVASIRSLKPLVVVCCHDLTSSDRYRDAISLQQLVNRAIDLAADGSDLHSHTRSHAQHKPWQVQRLVTSDLAGSVRLDSRRMMPSLGVTVSDQIAISRAMLGQSIRSQNFSNWRVTHPAKSRTMKGNDLLSGLSRKGTPVPTRHRQTALGNLDRMNQALARHKHTERLIEMTTETDQDLAAWRQSLLAATTMTDENLAGLWVTDLAERYLAAGRFDMVDHTLEVLATYWSDHAFAPAANAWLTIKRGQDSFAHESSASTRETQHRILEPFRKLTQHDPSMMLEPAWQWRELNLLARSSGLRSVEPRLTQLSQLRLGDQANRSFATVAQEELSLLRSAGHSENSSASHAATRHLSSVFAPQRPKLDGRLDDTLWRDAVRQRKMATFKIPSIDSAHNSDQIIFAHDDQFLYGAIHCQKLPTQRYRLRQGTRTRDPDLSRNDRVELTIDPSLNFCGGIKLTLDHQGWVAESKLAGKGWDPDWYVSGVQDKKTWTVEFAIPLKTLSERAPNQPVHPSDNSCRGWAVKVCRLDERSRSVWGCVPHVKDQVGLQASLKPDPTGFRRLIFDSNPDLVTSSRDVRVQPAQYQLESKAEPNRFAAPPQVPDYSNSNSETR